MHPPIKKVIWLVKDGKRGHENQSNGLIQALSKLTRLETVEIDVRSQGVSWLDFWIGRRCRNFMSLQSPDLIIGTGSQTHATILSAGRVTQAPTIVVMSPPRCISRLFDLCILPEHDGRTGTNVVMTKGALNQVEIQADKDAKKGLILIGGPSKHHHWDEVALTKQVEQIHRCDPETYWTLTTSRRTPAGTTAQLLGEAYPRCDVVPVEKTDADWLPTQLARASHVWVTEDSVSMIYEALSSGAKVGVLPVPRKSKNSRVIRGVDQLLAEGRAFPYLTDSCDMRSFDAPAPLAEAERVARIIHQRFLRPEVYSPL